MNKYLKYLPFLSTVILIVVSIYMSSTFFTYERLYILSSTFIDVEEVSDKYIKLPEFITYVLIGVCGVLIAVKNKLWSYLFALILLLSSVHILQVFIYTYSVGFLALKIEMISVALLFLQISLNKDMIQQIADKFEFNDSKVDKVDHDLVKSFQQKFESKTDDEIALIIESDSYSKEAKTAAENIKGNRADIGFN